MAKITKYSERWFVDHMRYLDINVADIKSPQDLRDKMRQARWKKGARFGRPQTAALRARLVDVYAQRIRPLQRQAEQFR